jgi:hypothetical protein
MILTLQGDVDIFLWVFVLGIRHVNISEDTFADESFVFGKTRQVKWRIHQRISGY